MSRTGMLFVLLAALSVVIALDCAPGPGKRELRPVTTRLDRLDRFVTLSAKLSDIERRLDFVVDRVKGAKDTLGDSPKRLEPILKYGTSQTNPICDELLQITKQIKAEIERLRAELAALGGVVEGSQSLVDAMERYTTLTSQLEEIERQINLIDEEVRSARESGGDSSIQLDCGGALADLAALQAELKSLAEEITKLKAALGMTG